MSGEMSACPHDAIFAPAHAVEAGTKEVCGRASGTPLHTAPFPKEGETANVAKENTSKPWKTTQSLSFISCYHQVWFK